MQPRHPPARGGGDPAGNLPRVADQRPAAPRVAQERVALAAWLDRHRATVVDKLDGLTDAEARRPMLASGVSLLALVKHLTAVEHGWFVVNFAQTGERDLFVEQDGTETDWVLKAEDTLVSVVSGYQRACARSRAVVASAISLDDRAPHPRGGEMDLRFVLLHMLEETARHNGHADAARELLDGVTGD